MKKKDDGIYLAHMLQAVEKIERLASRPPEDEAIRDAIERNLSIIGDAAGNLSPEIVEAYPKVPWKEIIGFRHKLIHDYSALKKTLSGMWWIKICPISKNKSPKSYSI